MKESSGAEKGGAAKKPAKKAGSAKTSAKPAALSKVKPAEKSAGKAPAKRGRPAAAKTAKPAALPPVKPVKKPAKAAKTPAPKPKTPKASSTKTPVKKTKAAGKAEASSLPSAKTPKKRGRPAAAKTSAKPTAKPAKKPGRPAAEKPVKAEKKPAKKTGTSRTAAKKPGRPAAAKKPGRPGRTAKASARAKPATAASKKAAPGTGKSPAFSYCSCPSTELSFSRIIAALPRENILYILEDNRVLSSWDTGNPREIKKLGEITLERTPFKMKLSGNTLYVLRKPHWFNFKRSYYIDIIDITNPASFFIKEQIKLDFAVSSLCVDTGGSLLVTGEEGIYRIKAGSLSLVYASDEESRLGSGSVDIAVKGSLCFAAGDHEVGLSIFTILSDGKLSLLKHLPAPGYLFTEAPIHFYKEGKFLQFVRDETFIMADIREPDKARVLETVKIPGLKLCGKIVLSGNEAWLFGLSRTAQDENILAVVDLKETGPALKTKIGLAEYGQRAAANDDVKALFRQDNYLFVLTFNRGLGLFEIR